MRRISFQRLSGLAAGILLTGLSLNGAAITQIDVTVQNWDSSKVGPILSPLTLTPATSTFSVFPATYLGGPHTSVDFNAYEPGNTGVSVDIEFAGPAAKTPNGSLPTELLPGTYTNVVRWRFENPGEAGFDINIGSFGMNQVTGSFDIIEADWNPDGTLSSFAATFNVSDPTYANAIPTFIGDVYYNYNIPAASVPEPAPLVPLSMLLVAGVICGLRKRQSKKTV